VRLFNNAVGNGRWFDNYLCGLLPPQIGQVNEELRTRVEELELRV